MKQATAAFKPVPSVPPELKGNPSNPAKVELGKMLFFDPRLSSSWLISCNTCHNLGLGGVDALETSIGHGWQKGPRNSPTVLNSVFNIAQFWDGRAKDLREQAKGPVQAAVEMNSTPERTVETLRSMAGYVEHFQRAFPGEPEAVTFDNMAKAIEVFEATLLTPDSTFDRYLKGEDGALNNTEKEGLRLFMSKGCGSCHGGVNLGGRDILPSESWNGPAPKSYLRPTRVASLLRRPQVTSMFSSLHRCETSHSRHPISTQAKYGT